MSTADRGLSSTNTTNVTSDVIYPVYFFELNLDSGPLRFCTNPSSLTLNGNTFVGTPDIISFSPAKETKEIVSNPASLRISAIPNNNVRMALDEPYQNREFKAWIGFLDSSYGYNLDDAFLIFSGLMDKMVIHKGAEESVIEIVSESYLVDLTNTNPRRYTHGDQTNLVNSKDEGLSFIASLQEKPILFGGQEAFKAEDGILRSNSEKVSFTDDDNGQTTDKRTGKT